MGGRFASEYAADIKQQLDLADLQVINTRHYRE
jgi:hypothetical protein